MSRNLGQTDCYFCGGDVVPDEEPRTAEPGVDDLPKCAVVTERRRIGYFDPEREGYGRLLVRGRKP